MRTVEEIKNRIKVCEARLFASEDVSERSSYRIEISALRWVLNSAI